MVTEEEEKEEKTSSPCGASLLQTCTRLFHSTMKLYHRLLAYRHRKRAGQGSGARSLVLLQLFGFIAITTIPVVAGAAAPAPEASPRRIVSLVPAITETLFEVGAGERVVAVSDYCDRPPQVSRLPRAGTFLAPAVERVIALEPDLVLTSPTPGNENGVLALRRAGLRVEVVDNEGGISDTRRVILEIAGLVGRKTEGERLVAEIDADLQRARARAAGRAHPRVAVVVGREPLVLAGPASFLGELVTAAGGTNVAEQMGGRWPRMGMEALLAAAPEVLIDVSMGSEAGGQTELAARWGRFASMPAVAGGRLYSDPSSLFLRPGPRTGKAALALAAMLYPQEHP